MVKTGDLGFKARSCGFSPRPMDGSAGHHLAVGSNKGKVVILSESDMRPLFQFKDVSGPILDLKYSPDGSYLAVASEDTFIDIYSTARGYKRVSRCSGHSANVLQVDWSADGSIIQTASSAYELLYFDPKTGKQVYHNQKDTRWATWTSILGFPVMGMWPEGADGTDINSVDRSPDGHYLVTSGDDGLVRLFNYPCVVEDAPYRAYRGHSSHVMMVRWNAEGSVVCSVGGDDRSILQFRFVPLGAPPPPPPSAPAPVWGPLDPEGRSFGWVRPRQADGAATEDDQAGPSMRSSAPQQQEGAFLPPAAGPRSPSRVGKGTLRSSQAFSVHEGDLGIEDVAEDGAHGWGV